MKTLRMVIIEVWTANNEKRLRRYTEWFLDACSLSREERTDFALINVQQKFGKCFPVGSIFRLHKGNQ